MNVICIEDKALYALIDEVYTRIKAEQNIKEDRWILGEEAMRKLGISSKTTLQKMRDEGKIRFSQPEKKIILYDLQSIYQYLEKHAKNIF